MGRTPEAVANAVQHWETAGRPSQASVSWRRGAWLDALPGHRETFAALPASLDRTAVETAVSDYPETVEGVVAAFLVTAAWGYGQVGYGPYRVAQILEKAGSSIGEHLLEATLALRGDGPLAGYRVLARSGRPKGLGPSFGTKFLFYQSVGRSRALILDRLVSRWIAENCELRFNPERWSTSAYGAYLEHMKSWAEECQLEPATLEMVLFMEEALKGDGQWRSAEAHSVTRSTGNPQEFDDELSTAVHDPDEPGSLDVPPGLLRQLAADPVHAAEHLAARAAERHCGSAAQEVRLIRDRNPGATDRQLAVYFKRKYSRAARWEGAGTGAAGIFGLPADLVLLAWIQSRLVFSIAACYGHDMDDHLDRAADLLVLQGVHSTRELARKAIIKRTERVARKLLLRHLRGRPLVLVKQLFRLVRVDFTRKALLEKGVPLIAVPLSAGVNETSTRLLANQAIRFYDTSVG